MRREVLATKPALMAATVREAPHCMIAETHQESSNKTLTCCQSHSAELHFDKEMQQ